MGVKGLLNFLKKCIINVHISSLQEYVFAIDAYCWLHRSLFYSAMDLGLGKKTDKHINYILKFLNLLLENKIKPILVFDGKNLASKSIIEASRRKKKEECKKKAMEYMLAEDMKRARECFEQCIEVTPELANQALKAARDLGIDCIVAPYEADAQLMFLFSHGYADVIVTQDSDLITFGCRQVLFKMDADGNGDLFTWSSGIAEKCCNLKPEQFTEDIFRQICILSGCDYFPGVPGIGLLTACKIIAKARYNSFRELLDNLGIYTKLNAVAQSEIPQLELLCWRIREKIRDEKPKINFVTTKGKNSNNSAIGKLPESTIEAAICAELTFKHQVVFDPKERRQVRITNPNLPEEEILFAGKIEQDTKKALDVALGNVDCLSGCQFDSFHPDTQYFNLVKNAFKSQNKSLSSTVSSSNANIEQTKKKQICLNFNPVKLQKTDFDLVNAVRCPSRDRIQLSIWDPNYPLRKVWLNHNEKGLYCHVVEDQQGPMKSVVARKSVKREADTEIDDDFHEFINDPKILRKSNQISTGSCIIDKNLSTNQIKIKESEDDSKTTPNIFPKKILTSPIRDLPSSTLRGSSVYFNRKSVLTKPEKFEKEVKEEEITRIPETCFDKSPSLSPMSGDDNETLNEIISSALQENSSAVKSPIFSLSNNRPSPIKRSTGRNIFAVSKSEPEEDNVESISETLFEPGENKENKNFDDIFLKFQCQKRTSIQPKEAISKDVHSLEKKTPQKPDTESTPTSPIISSCLPLSPPLPQTPPMTIFGENSRNLLTTSSDVLGANRLLNPSFKKSPSIRKMTRKPIDSKQGDLRDFFKKFNNPSQLRRFP